jgi:hypothetical protein
MEKKTGGAAAARAGHVEGWRNHRPWDDQQHSESYANLVPPLATLAFPTRMMRATQRTHLLSITFHKHTAISS